LAVNSCYQSPALAAHPPDWQDQIQASLQRAQEAISRGQTQQAEMVQAWTESLRSAYPDWGRERWQRRLERKLRKRAEREAKIAQASLFSGYVRILAAVLLFIIMISGPFSWWLLFPAAWLGSQGVRIVARHAGVTRPPIVDAPPEQRQLSSNPVVFQSPGGATSQAQSRARASRFGSIGSGGPGTSGVGNGASPSGLNAAFRSPGQRVAPPPAVPRDPRDLRVDTICDKILVELKSSPEVVKEIFRKPEETVQALRTTCRDLSRREREVRAFLSPEEDARLSREREALQRKVDSEDDEITKMRLASALAALDQQRDQRAELGRAAARFDAEHTRISYTLESLYTQVVRMRSADSSSVDVAGAGLRRSLDMLSQEVNALADALEKVNSGEAARMTKVQAQGPDDPGQGGNAAPGNREKA